METKQKGIQELENELNKKLKGYACSYYVSSSTMRGDKKINGKHISVNFPEKVKVNIKEIVALFELYYGNIKKVGKVTKFTNGCSGITFQTFVLNLELGY